jgi:hypothetical protein
MTTNATPLIHELNYLRDELEARTKSLQHEVKTMALDLSILTAQVAATAGVEASAVTLIDAIAAELTAQANDPAAVTALANQLKAATDPLAAAIAANIPGANTP